MTRIRFPAPFGAALGVDAVEMITGDVTDPNAVERDARGCDTVRHAASTFSRETRRAGEMRAVSPPHPGAGDLSRGWRRGTSASIRRPWVSPRAVEPGAARSAATHAIACTA
jgi:hypothetical protein